MNKLKCGCFIGHEIYYTNAHEGTNIPLYNAIQNNAKFIYLVGNTKQYNISYG